MSSSPWFYKVSDFFSNYHLKCVRMIRTHKPIVLWLQIAIKFWAIYTHWQTQYRQSCRKASEYKKKQEYKTSRSKTQQYHNTYPYKWGLFEHIIDVPQKFNRFGCCMQYVLVSQINDLPLRYVAAEHFNSSSSVFLLRFFSDSCYICIVFCRHVFWFLFIYLLHLLT